MEKLLLPLNLTHEILWIEMRRESTGVDYLHIVKKIIIISGNILILETM